MIKKALEGNSLQCDCSTSMAAILLIQRYTRCIRVSMNFDRVDTEKYLRQQDIKVSVSFVSVRIMNYNN